MPEATAAAVTHDAPKGFVTRYIFSRDHKVIGLQYFTLSLIAALWGVALSLLMRSHLIAPQASWGFLEWLFPEGAPNGVMTPELYLALMTMHGTVMVFFVLTTVIQSGFGNYFLPIQIGADDMAFPTLNMLSFWLTFLGFLTLVVAMIAAGGGPISGWTAYPPLSAVGEIAGPGLGTGQVLWIVAIAFFCLASMLGALNFIVTTINLRAEGMSMMRLPLTCWAWFATGAMALVAFGVLLAAGILLLMDHLASTAFFIPEGLIVSDRIIEQGGGSPILWQHLLWFFGHPEVYIIIVPALGVISHILAVMSRKPVFCYRAVVTCLATISTLGFFVWGHHMFVSGMNPFTSITFSILTIAISMPAGAIAVTWLGTLWRGKIIFNTPMVFALGFISYFVSGGIGGLFLGQAGLDIHLHDTYFVVGHFHIIMGMAAAFGTFAGTYFWFPKCTGRKMNEGLGQIHFWLTFIGGYIMFISMHLQGLAGHPRRYPDIETFDFLQPLMPLHELITVAALVTAAAQLIFLINLLWSIKNGEAAGDNPWNATNLEWTVPSPPPHDNFGGRRPVVTQPAYEYSRTDASHDYVMQDEPV